MDELWEILAHIGKTSYKALSDPVWQSIGVILGALGVYFGARWGSKRGHQLAVKQQEADFKAEFDSFVISFEEELKANRECLFDMRSYIYMNHPPIIEAFDPVEVGAIQLKTQVWESLLKTGMAVKFFEYEDFRSLSKANVEVSRAARIALIYTANWRRVLSCREWEEKRGIQQVVDMTMTMNTFSDNIKTAIEMSVASTERAIKIVEGKLLY